MSKFCTLRAKTYAFLIDEYADDDYEKNKIINEKAKGRKKCVLKKISYLIIMSIHYLKMRYC